MIIIVHGLSVDTTSRSDVTGPVFGADYTWVDKFNVSSTSYSPCGESTILNINADVRVNNANNRAGSGYLATDQVSCQTLW